MTAAAEVSFVDTNVLVYAVTRDDRRFRAASSLIEELITSNALRTSSQVLQEFYVVSTSKIAVRLSVHEALEFLDVCASCPVTPIDYAAIREAAVLSSRRRLSFWDALIVVAAKRCGAKRLYTEDLNHGQKIEGVEVVNPFR